MYYNLPETEYRRIKPEQLRHYLEIMGWQPADEIAGRVSIYHRAADADAEIVVPLDTRFRDYARLVAEAVHDLSALRAQPLDVTLHEIRQPDYDRLSIRVQGYSAADHQIGLLTGVHLYNAVLSMLNASAHDVLAPEKVHKSLDRREVDCYLKACRLGPFEQDGFVTNIYCPANMGAVESHCLNGSHPQESIKLPDGGFARNVTLHVMCSLDTTVRLIRSGDVDRLSEAAEAGTISANFFEALARLEFEDGMTAIEIMINWAPGIPMPSDLPSHIIILPGDISIFKDFARNRP